MSQAMAERLPPCRESIATAAKRLRDGRLVAFPTETVYGLGANALDEEAVLNIFRSKGRPLTDPVIVHVPSTEKALELLELDDETKRLFCFLAGRFWPGPLTMVAKARSVLPRCVSAGTGFVGVRRPAHAMAQALLEASGVPIAAPSANRFGHVSPTRPAHVLADLRTADVTILDVEVGDAPCSVGIESTVLGIARCATGELTLYRRGGVSERQLARALASGGFGDLRLLAPSHPVPDGDTAAQEAPGQLLTHYAPDVVTYLVERAAEAEVAASAAAADPALRVPGGGEVDRASAVVIDFGGALRGAGLGDGCLAYRDLSKSGSVSEAAHALFEALRWSEGVEGAQAVLLARLDESANEHAPALADRMFRAASGRVVRLR